MLHLTKDTLFGFLGFPFFWLILKFIVQRIYAGRAAIIEWYIGMPLKNWPGVLLILLGSKLISSSKFCRYEVREGRLWLSPRTFVVKDDAGTRPNPDRV